MDIREVTRYLLTQRDIVEQLKTADNYVQAYNRLPDQFVLPAKHAHLKAIIESFAADADAFARYIRAIRDGVSDATAYDGLHHLYRTVSTRALQVSRRARVRKACAILIPKLQERIGAEFSYADIARLQAFVEKAWGAMRLRAMADARRELKVDRLTSEGRAMALSDFWREMDKQIEAGTVPLDDMTIEDLLSNFVPSKT